MPVTATQVKSRFGAICAQVKEGSVFEEKDGRIDSVILSAKQFAELLVANRTETLAQRQAQFEQSHSAWLAEPNPRFEAQGLWCDDMRVWYASMQFDVYANPNPRMSDVYPYVVDVQIDLLSALVTLGGALGRHGPRHQRPPTSAMFGIHGE